MAAQLFRHRQLGPPLVALLGVLEGLVEKRADSVAGAADLLWSCGHELSTGSCTNAARGAAPTATSVREVVQKAADECRETLQSGVAECLGHELGLHLAQLRAQARADAAAAVTSECTAADAASDLGGSQLDPRLEGRLSDESLADADAHDVEVRHIHQQESDEDASAEDDLQDETGIEEDEEEEEEDMEEATGDEEGAEETVEDHVGVKDEENARRHMLLESMGGRASPSTPPTTQPQLQIGDIVEAHSLSAASELNGCVGRVVGQQGDSRLQVEFGPPHCGKALRIRNLRLAAGPSCQGRGANGDLERID